MAKLNADKRSALPDSVFAGPGRSYPVEDRAHAANAKARATQMQMASKGKLSATAAARIRARATSMLGKSC